MALFFILYLGFIAFIIASVWKTFEKAGQPGWASIIPIYNCYIMAKIGGVKNWWLILIPFVNIYIAFVISIAIAKSFGKGTGFGIGLIFLGFIFYPMLAFGDAQYIGPNGIHQMNEIDNIGNNTDV